MGIKRAARPGTQLVIPLLCDPLYQERRRAALAAAAAAVCDDADADGEQIRRAALAAARVEGARQDAAEALFADTLDASVLLMPLEGVTLATVRGLSGQDFEAADSRVDPALRMVSPVAARYRAQAETVRAGLAAIAIDGGTSGPKDGLYDVEALANECGELWPAVRGELDARIRTLSHLGPSAGSSSAPSSGEPTLTAMG